MAALEIWTDDTENDGRSHLVLVERTGRARPNLVQRRALRARRRRVRRRVGLSVALLASLAVLMAPGHAFGGTTGAGLSSDVAGSATLASGMLYVVQPGDTLNTLAREMNPVAPSLARAALVHELGSSVVVVGEHVVIP